MKQKKSRGKRKVFFRLIFLGWISLFDFWDYFVCCFWNDFFVWPLTKLYILYCMFCELIWIRILAFGRPEVGWNLVNVPNDLWPRCSMYGTFTYVAHDCQFLSKRWDRRVISGGAVAVGWLVGWFVGCWRDLHCEKKHVHKKGTTSMGNTSSNHWFSGDMSNFGSVNVSKGEVTKEWKMIN